MCIMASLRPLGVQCRTIKLLLVLAFMLYTLFSNGIAKVRVPRATSSFAASRPTKADKPRIIIAVAAFFVERRISYIVSVIEEFMFRYPCCDIDIRIDVSSDSSRHNATFVIDSLTQVLPSPTTLQEGKRYIIIYNDVMIDLNGQPFNLVSVHRSWMRAALNFGPMGAGFSPYAQYHNLTEETTDQLVGWEYNYFMYVEDDILIPEAAFLHYLNRYRILWKNGWIYTFVRTEVNASAPNILVSTDMTEPMQDPSIFDDGNGNMFVQLVRPYHAFWILDREQIVWAINDESNIWLEGSKIFGARERYAIGFIMKLLTVLQDDGKVTHRWINRGATPVIPVPSDILLDDKLKSAGVESPRFYMVDPACFVKHLPSNYVKEKYFLNDIGSVPVVALLHFTRQLEPQELPHV